MLFYTTIIYNYTFLSVSLYMFVCLSVSLSLSLSLSLILLFYDFFLSYYVVNKNVVSFAKWESMEVCVCVCGGGVRKGNTQVKSTKGVSFYLSICHALDSRCVLYTGFRHFGFDQPYYSPEVKYPRKSHR